MTTDPNTATPAISPRYQGVRWVWFDLDDTIVDFTGNSRQALAMLYDGTPLLQRCFSSAEEWMLVYESYNRPLWEMYNRGDITAAHLRRERFAGPLADAGVPRPEAEAAADSLDVIYLDILANRPGVVEGAVELIRHLHSRGYRIGVLSNGFHGVQERKLETAGVSGYIDCIVLSDDINVNKPHLPIFEHAMKMAAEPDPSSHLMIGDNPTTDIAGALNAGWQAIHLDPQRRHAGHFVHRLFRVDSLIEVLPLL